MGVGTGGVSSFLYTGVSGLGVSLPNGLSIPFPTLDLDFANTNSLDTRITFTRASNATYFDANGVLQTASSGVARFDHNPTTLESLGLLIEEQRTNLLTYSEEFDNAAWTKVQTTITSNTIIAPDGTLTGDKLIVDNAQPAGYVVQTKSFTSGTSYTATCYVKAGEVSDFRFVFGSGAFGSSLNAIFDLSTGTVTSFTVSSASIQSVGNGWYRCIATAAATITASAGVQVRSAYTGDGTSGIYIWGAQLEAGAFATSYIPTVASSVTRNADLATMTGVNFSSWYNQDEGTVYGEYEGINNVSGATRRLVEIGVSGFGANRLILGYSSTLNTRFLVVESSSTQADITNSSTPSASVAAAYKNNSFAVSANGNTVQTDDVGNVPIVNAMAIGAQFTAGANTEINGTIKRLAYYPVRLSNDQLQALTR